MCVRPVHSSQMLISISCHVSIPCHIHQQVKPRAVKARRSWVAPWPWARSSSGWDWWSGRLISWWSCSSSSFVELLGCYGCSLSRGPELKPTTRPVLPFSAASLDSLLCYTHTHHTHKYTHQQPLSHYTQSPSAEYTCMHARVYVCVCVYVCVAGVF